MFKIFVVGLLAYAIGIGMGKWDIATEIADGCNTDMNIVILDHEYICMRVAEEGLAQNYEQLKSQY